jgi:hypothetical protein
MSTEKEILAQIEELRKKAKDMEENNKDNEFNKKRNSLIKITREFLGIEVSDEEVLAVMFKYSNNTRLPYLLYVKKEDKNMLLERKVLNRYAKYNEIRFEDSDAIIYDFLSNIDIYILSNDLNVKLDLNINLYGSKRRKASKKGSKKAINNI